MHIPPHSCKGFAILLALVVLAVVGVSLAAAARRSADKALKAAGMLRDVQIKWALLSCQHTLLKDARIILATAAKSEGRQSSRIAAEIVLGDLHVQWVLSDEQAKINANFLDARYGSHMDAQLRRLLAAQGQPPGVHLRPCPVDPSHIGKYPQRYASFDQLFDAPSPTQLMATASGTAAADVVTCWGNGKINYKTCSAEALRMATAGILNETQVDYLDKVAAFPVPPSLVDALKKLHLDGKKQTEAMEVLTDRSACHSLWVCVKGRARSWHSLFILAEADIGSDSRRLTFQW